MCRDGKWDSVETIFGTLLEEAHAPDLTAMSNGLG